MSLALKWGNLTLAFLLELCLLAALAYWGFYSATAWPVRIALGVGVPLAVAIFWGMFMAPRARFPVSRTLYWVNYAALFGLGALALGAAGQPKLAVTFAIVTFINAILTAILRQG